MKGKHRLFIKGIELKNMVNVEYGRRVEKTTECGMARETTTREGGGGEQTLLFDVWRQRSRVCVYE